MTRTTTPQPAEKLTPGDRTRFEDQKAELEAQLAAIHGKETAAVEAIDESIVKRNLQKTNEILEKDEELIAKGRHKDALQREARELEKELLENMPTKNEMWPTRMGTPEAERCVQKQMRFERLCGDKARRWQDIQRRLDPHNPHAQSLDRIRPDR